MEQQEQAPRDEAKDAEYRAAFDAHTRAFRRGTPILLAILVAMAVTRGGSGWPAPWATALFVALTIWQAVVEAPRLREFDRIMASHPDPPPVHEGGRGLGPRFRVVLFAFLGLVVVAAVADLVMG